MTIRIFQDINIERLAKEVNDFEKSHSVFETQHSTVLAGEGSSPIITIIVSYREAKE